MEIQMNEEYKVEELGVKHQVCLAHVRKNVKRRLN
jgi:hypothetical protein